uniref:VWFA domain-containing protein n=1 Tax=Aegilops tauschii TaxID=37682 RepID=R7W441_AEGTA
MSDAGKASAKLTVQSLFAGGGTDILKGLEKAAKELPRSGANFPAEASAKLTVQSLFAGGGTDILKGLEKAAKVLDSRRHKNVVAGVILLSDGQDNYLWRRSYRDLVPTSLRNSNNDGRSTAPIHTFGFGTDHDPAAMHAVAELTGGSYSFIENEAVVQDAFAQCIGGLLSVTAQQAWIAIACVHPEVRVRAVKSGRYKSRVLADGRAASVDVGELYADEERRFLLFVDVPRVVGAAADEAMTTSLVKVSCTYKDTTTGKSMEVAAEDAVVRRPLEVTVEEPSTEVEVERFRVEALEDIAAPQAAAERGETMRRLRGYWTCARRRRGAIWSATPGAGH